MWGVVVASIAFVLLGVVVARAWVLAVPVVFWVVWFAGLRSGAWGSGTGDDWQYGALGLIALGLLCVAAGIIARRMFAGGRITQ